MARHPYPMHVVRLRKPFELPEIAACFEASSGAGVAAGAVVVAAGGDEGGAAGGNTLKGASRGKGARTCVWVLGGGS